MGLVTGMIWAKNTWGAYWTNDPKLNSAAIGMLMYAAYFVLRNSIEDEEKKARISAVYNLFALPVFIVLIFVLPRLTASLHPGNGGNPGFNSYDLDSRLRLVFYPAVLGWIFIGFWIADLQIRVNKITFYKDKDNA
jgi:heme exporter protein C